MASITLPMPEEFRGRIKNFPWINWSEIAREEVMKKAIFENYMKTKEVTDEEWEFCESIDWHPVDELPLKKEFIKKMEQRRKGPFIKFNSVDEIFKK